MSKRPCLGCGSRGTHVVRQLRVYSRIKQYQFRIILCHECFGGLFDLIKHSADGMTEGLWNPLPAITKGVQ
jgi:hypothetical protein